MNLKTAFNYWPIIMPHRFAALATLLLLGACRPTLPSATPADADRASQSWPGTTVADLEHGRQIYLERCSSCHQPVAPARVTPADWPGHIAEMKGRAHLSDEQARLVERYVVTMSRAHAAQPRQARR